MLYILAVEDNPDMLELYQLSLMKVFPHEIVGSASTAHAIDQIKTRGRPELVIFDDRLLNGEARGLVEWIGEHHLEVPYIVSSSLPGNVLQKNYPGAYGYLERPKVSESLLEMVSDILAGRKSLLNYVPISIELLLKLGRVEFDLHMKLSYANYVKVLREGDSFVKEDALKFSEKNITHLYLAAPDGEKFIRSFEEGLEMVMSSNALEPGEAVHLSLESLDTAERLGRNLGWTPQVLESAKKSAGLAIRAISTSPRILQILMQKNRKGSSFSKHTSLVSMVACCLAQQLGWVSESTQMKLAIAALMHDIAVDEEVYLGLSHWNECAANPKALDPDTVNYRTHPQEALTMLRDLKNLPPDIDHIILQHHEKEDGSGFPYRLTANRISPLTCVFIIAEDLVTFTKEDSVEFSVKEFVKLREDSYRAGTFKKVFQVIKENVIA